MIPCIVTPLGDISTFSLCIVFGILAMLLMVHMSLKKTTFNYIAEENYIYPKMVISGLIGYVSSGLFDSLLKYRVYGTFKLTGITFYGGLIGAILALFFLLKTSQDRSKFATSQWYALLTPPFIVFHIFGRVGCFLGGCCYGKITNSRLGVVFPDNAAQNIYHYGEKCYPTQLFEAAALIFIFMLLTESKHKFADYILLYSTARFIIEFFRGDERGVLSELFSPSQVVSIILFLISFAYKIRIIYDRKRYVS